MPSPSSSRLSLGAQNWWAGCLQGHLQSLSVVPNTPPHPFLLSTSTFAYSLKEQVPEPDSKEKRDPLML